jgi:hypothetical protein
VADGIGHDDDGEAEGKRNAEEPDPAGFHTGGEDGGSTTAKDKNKRPEKFRGSTAW